MLIKEIVSLIRGTLKKKRKKEKKRKE